MASQLDATAAGNLTAALKRAFTAAIVAAGPDFKKLSMFPSSHDRVKTARRVRLIKRLRG